MQPILSVIIPAHNAESEIDQCLKALFSSDFSDFECIVINNASTDNTSLTANKHPVKLIELPKNMGPGYARNKGVEAAKSELLLFIDADVTVKRDTLTKVAKKFEKDPHIDAFFGSYDAEPAAPGFISQYKNLFHHFIHQTSSTRAKTFWAGCGAIKREVFLKAGMFDERYISMEDVELGMRLTKAGHRIELIKDIQVKHLKKWTFLNLVKTDIFQRGIPWTMLMIKYKSIAKDLNLKRNSKISMLLVLLFMAAIPFILTDIRFIYLALFFLLVFLLMNMDFYRFFAKKKGGLFTLLVFPMHILYFIYSGLSVLLGTALYPFSKK